jgi:hypothetical protein
MDEKMNKLLIFSGGILIGYLIGKTKKCDLCFAKDYMIQ